MALPGFFKKHPVISTVLLLGASVLLTVLALNFAQGTFVDDQASSCTWQKAVNPDTGQVFDSKQDFRSYIQSRGKTVPEGLQLEYRDGVLYYRTPCGTVGGGDTPQ